MLLCELINRIYMVCARCPEIWKILIWMQRNWEFMHHRKWSLNRQSQCKGSFALGDDDDDKKIGCMVTNGTIHTRRWRQITVWQHRCVLGPVPTSWRRRHDTFVVVAWRERALKARKSTEHILHQICRSQKFCKISAKQTHPSTICNHAVGVRSSRK